MSVHRLVFSLPARTMTRLGTRDFIWLPRPAISSFRSSLSPGLEELDGARRQNIEFVRLAVLAFLTDRTTPRPAGWSRQLRLEVPVWDPDPWAAAATDLSRLLGFLTNDRWRIDFTAASAPKSAKRRRIPDADIYCLFSGGADSLSGAIEAHELGDVCLVSHRDWTITMWHQHQLVKRLGQLWGQPPPHITALIGRSEHQIGSGVVFGHEQTNRSRSLLFLAVGLAAASHTEAVLWVPENGSTSLNPPFGPERRGALSTHTTHPWYLHELIRILTAVGAHAQIHNPCANHTKGDLFATIAWLLGERRASTLLSASHSCARGDLRFAGRPGVHHCGICYPCLIRRAAFRAADLPDLTDYAVVDLDTPIGALNGWLTKARVADLSAIRYAASRGLDAATIIATPLPLDYPPTAAIDVARRGLQELAELVGVSNVGDRS